jgi:hypothetical protein
VRDETKVLQICYPAMTTPPGPQLGCLCMKTKSHTQTNVVLAHRNETVRGTLSMRRGTFPVKLSVVLLALFALAATAVRASDPIGVFARIDKVVLEPNESAPDRIQIFGAFCLADRKDRDSYLPPQKGYLYCKLPGEKSDVVRKEWNDLKSIAGTGDVIGFGSRHATLPKIRDAKEKPENPDAYVTGFGLIKARQRGTSYPPIKALQSMAEKKSETK